MDETDGARGIVASACWPGSKKRTARFAAALAGNHQRDAAARLKTLPPDDKRLGQNDSASLRLRCFVPVDRCAQALFPGTGAAHAWRAAGIQLA
jgi:hypothetical protein